MPKRTENGSDLQRQKNRLHELNKRMLKLDKELTKSNEILDDILILK